LGEFALNFAQQQRDPSRHLIGFGIVVLMHVILIYALVTGLARNIVEVIKQPLETKIIEEVKEKPPEPAVHPAAGNPDPVTDIERAHD
jgi:protein TonB